MSKSLVITLNNPLKYKFVFDDATTSFQDAEGYREATILIMANRIRSKKTKKILGCWVKNSDTKEWDHVTQESVTIQLKN